MSTAAGESRRVLAPSGWRTIRRPQDAPASKGGKRLPSTRTQLGQPPPPLKRELRMLTSWVRMPERFGPWPNISMLINGKRTKKRRSPSVFLIASGLRSSWRLKRVGKMKDGRPQARTERKYNAYLRSLALAQSTVRHHTSISVAFRLSREIIVFKWLWSMSRNESDIRTFSAFSSM